MKNTSSLIGVALLSFLVCGCTTTMTEEQRLRHESDANNKTVEKYRNLTLTGETKTESFGSRQTTESSASASVGKK